MKGWTFFYNGVITKEECEWITRYAQQLPVQEGTVGHGKGPVVDKAMRNSDVRWIKQVPDVQWLFDRVTLLAGRANRRQFFLDLGPHEPYLDFKSFQFTQYDSASQQHYDWHTDNCFVPPVWTPTDRKLSCVIQLSDPASYAGGKLELDGVTISDGNFKNQGDVLFFPSHLRHRVTPVTEGTRYSLVTWINGPRLR
jgi:PKHD-type hydroxylase